MGLQMRKIPYGYTFYPVLWKGEAYAVDLLWSRDGIVSGYVMVHICQYIEKKIFLYGHSGKRLFNAGKIYNPLWDVWVEMQSGCGCYRLVALYEAHGWKLQKKSGKRQTVKKELQIFAALLRVRG